MNERLKAWCERRMTKNNQSEANGYYWARNDARRVNVWVDDGAFLDNWGFSDDASDRAISFTDDPTPEQLYSICVAFGIRLLGATDDLTMLATHALSAADGIDPTTALALADEVQSRFRYPDITHEWLKEIGWSCKGGQAAWRHSSWQLQSVNLVPTGFPDARWFWRFGSSVRAWESELAHRGDLLKLMELFGHDWRNPPQSLDYNARDYHQWDDSTIERHRVW